MPIHGYPGNVITANPTAPTVSSASGVWTTEQQLIAKAAGNWPFTIPTQQISRSLRFNSADSAYLSRTPASTSNRRTWTWSGWIKRSTDKYSLLFAAGNVTDIWNTGTNCTVIGYWISTNQLTVYNNGTVFRNTAQLFRDPSAWYHIVVAFDTTKATAADRLRVYINGAEITSWDTNNAPTQNLDMAVNVNQNHFVGGQSTNVANAYFSGYLTEINFVDGQQLTPASFGQTNASTGVWEPIAYTGTYGTNGFYLNFSDNSGTTSTTLGKDYSGNGNNWTPNNFSVTAGAGNDSMVDSPTSYGTDTGVGGEVRGNYCTWNPVATNTVGVATLSNGNLDFSVPNTFTGIGTISAASGKYYWEVVATSNPVGVGLKQVNVLDRYSNSIYYMGSSLSPSGEKYVNGSASAYGASWTTGDVIGVAVDMGAGTVTFYKNGASQGAINLSTASITEFIPSVVAGAGVTFAGTANFGQRAFAYTAPSGFKALCTQNLPTPTIGATSTTQANDYFDTTLYTGTGSDLAIVNSGGMAPDLVWVKVRNQAFSHNLNDIIRGTNNRLQSDTTNAAGTTGIVSFNSNGFTTRGASGELGANGNTYVAWQWKANGAGVTNTAGTITSTVSANTTSGFSIVTYTGTGSSPQSIGHGLGATPAMIILKSRSATSDWYVNHVSIGTNDLRLNLTNASAANNFFSAKSSTTFTINFNQTGDWVAYCFAPVAGYSAFGSYTGNGSADGPFVYLGFRPEFIMTKSTSNLREWYMYDAARDTYNVSANYLRANTPAAEGSFTSYDMVSNGFKLRSSDTAFNGSGETYIYMAFAESPFKYALAR